MTPKHDLPEFEKKPAEPDFGHRYGNSAGIFIDAWGYGPFEIHVKGRVYCFEDSDRFGPALLNRDGDIASKQPGERHPFWHPYHRWLKSGRKVESDRKTCIVPPAARTVINCINGKPFQLVEEGDTDGDLVMNELAQKDVEALLAKIRGS